MQIEITQGEGFILAELSGAIDDDCGPMFADSLHPLVGRAGGRLIVDLSGSPRINSLGISHLVRLATDANTNGSRLIYAAPSPFIANVFQVTKLERFFETAESVEEASRRLADEGAAAAR